MGKGPRAGTEQENDFGFDKNSLGETQDAAIIGSYLRTVINDLAIPKNSIYTQILNTELSPNDATLGNPNVFKGLNYLIENVKMAYLLSVKENRKIYFKFYETVFYVSADIVENDQNKAKISGIFELVGVLTRDNGYIDRGYFGELIDTIRSEMNLRAE